MRRIRVNVGNRSLETAVRYVNTLSYKLTITNHVHRHFIIYLHLHFVVLAHVRNNQPKVQLCVNADSVNNGQNG